VSIPDQFPLRTPRAVSVTGALSEGIAEARPAGTPDVAPSPGSWPWQRAALRLWRERARSQRER
jgi:hypothetical protein